METRQTLLDRIRAHFPAGIDPNFDVGEETVLEELGLKSLHLITLLLALQREYGLEVDQFVEHGMPITVGDLVTLLADRVQAS